MGLFECTFEAKGVCRDSPVEEKGHADEKHYEKNAPDKVIQPFPHGLGFVEEFNRIGRAVASVAKSINELLFDNVAWSNASVVKRFSCLELLLVL